MRRSAVLVSTVIVLPAVAFASGFRVSNFKKENKLGADYWNAASALDGKMETCWQVDPESENVGEWIEVDVPNSDVDKFSIVIGWDKSAEVFKDYPRVKAGKVELFTVGGAKVLEQAVTFEDKEGWQTIDLPDTHVGSDMGGGKFRLTVTDVYAGEDYPNLAVSEVLVRLKETDIGGQAIKVKEAPTEAAGHDASMMLDGNPKTFWAAASPGEATFSIAADGHGVSSIGFVQGPASNARPKTVEITAHDNTSRVTLQDVATPQWFEVPGVIGYTGSGWGAVSVHVIDSYPGKTDQSPSLTEVNLRSTNYEGL